MRSYLLFPFICCLLLPDMANAQNDVYQFTALPFDDLSAFKDPGKNWQVVEAVSGGFDENQFKSEAGKGVLLNTISERDQKYQASQNLYTNWEHGDILLELDFIMPKGSNSGIYLQGRYEIQLLDSWGISIPKSGDVGGIYERWDENKPAGQKGYEGHPPRINASFAPGLWQHLKIEFQAPRFDKNGRKIENAKFVKVVLNGVTIQENIIVSGPTRAAGFQDEKPKGPIMIQGDHGSVAFKNIRYTLLNDFEFSISEINYEYYEDPELKSFDQVKPSQLVRKGVAEGLDIRLADAKNQFYIVYTGKFLLQEPDEYKFSMLLSGIGSLEVDGKTVIEPKESHIGGEPIEGSLYLNSGQHSFRLQCIKTNSWFTPGLGLIVQKNNSRPKPLHVPASLPELTPAPLMEVQALNEPKVLRSYLVHNGKKKTHCISVGDPSGVNFSYDLKQAGLLQVWKGPFLNASEMWHERGYQQITLPMGAILNISGACPVSIFSDASHMLPDSLNDQTELLYEGYLLDQERYPTFQYQLYNTRISDRFLPYENGKGLIRIVSVDNPPSDKQLVFRLAEGDNIKEVSEGLYLVKTKKSGFYIRLMDKKIKPGIQKKAGGGKALTVLNPSGKESVNELKYVMIW
jgi:hypothetical protein